MGESSSFRSLIDRICGGDQTAAAALVKQYEPEVRRLIRVKLTDPNIRRLVDSTDICQSVLAAFFVRLSAGQFDLSGPDDLLKLLATMARNKIIDLSRKPAAHRVRTAEPGVLDGVAEGGESPSAVVSLKELLARARERMTADELSLAEDRAAGKSWDETAAARGVTAEAARKRLGRALDRVCRELGIDGVGDE